MTMVAGNLRDAATHVVNGYDLVTINLANGEHVTLEIKPDTDTRPEDSDEYGEADKEYFHKGEWCFVGLLLVKDDDTSATVWGVERNRCEDETDWFTMHLVDLATELQSHITDAGTRLALDSLIESASG